MKNIAARPPNSTLADPCTLETFDEVPNFALTEIRNLQTDLLPNFGLFDPILLDVKRLDLSGIDRPHGRNDPKILTRYQGTFQYLTPQDDSPVSALE